MRTLDSVVITLTTRPPWATVVAMVMMLGPYGIIFMVMCFSTSDFPLIPAGKLLVNYALLNSGFLRFVQFPIFRCGCQNFLYHVVSDFEDHRHFLFQIRVRKYLQDIKATCV
jgi:hypothetical protein